MSFSGDRILIPGLEASGDLSSAQYRFVKMSATAKQVSQCSVDGEAVVGVLLNKPSAAGRAAQVAALGTIPVEAGEAITAGDYIKTDSSGRAAKAEQTSTGADVGDFVVGTAIESASAAGDLVTVFVGIPQTRVFVS